MIWLAAMVLGGIVLAIMALAWPSPPPEPVKPKVIGYDKRGNMIYERAKSTMDIWA